MKFPGAFASWDLSANIRVEIICEKRVARNRRAAFALVYSDNYAMVPYMTDVSVLRVEKF